MPTPVFLTGMEHGKAVAGAAVTPANDRIWGGVTTTGGTPTIESTGAIKHGARVLRVPGSATGLSHVNRVVQGSPNVAVISVYLLFEGSLPSADCRVLAFTTSGSFCFLKFIASDSSIRVSTGATDAASGQVVVADQWYLVDLRFTISANPWVLAMTVDGVAQAGISTAIAANTFTGFRLGGNVDTTTATVVARWDDFVLSTTSADYPMGEHECLKMSPNADGTHNFTANDFIRGDAGAAILTSDTDVWTLVDDVPFGSIGTTDSVQQNVINATGYVELAFEAAPSAEDAWGIQVHGQFDADATGADTSGMRLWDGTTEDTLYGPPNGDVSNTTECFLSFCRALNPSGGAWTTAALAALRARWGFAGDVTGSPILHALMIEAAYPIAAGGQAPRSLHQYRLRRVA